MNKETFIKLSDAFVSFDASRPDYACFNFYSDNSSHLSCSIEVAKKIKQSLENILEELEKNT